MTFRRLREQLQRELHRELTPEEVRALRLAQQATPVPVLVERRKGAAEVKDATGQRTPTD